MPGYILASSGHDQNYFEIFGNEIVKRKSEFKFDTTCFRIILRND